MSQKLTLSNGSGGSVPNFLALGYKWGEEQRLAEELQSLWERQQETGRATLAWEEEATDLVARIIEAYDTDEGQK
jgi:hypothetical protein